MKATQLLHEYGQSLWLDNISRELLDSNRLKQYIEDFSITGLTSNPTIFDHAIKNGDTYDTAIAKKMGVASSSEALFFDLAIEDLARAADLFSSIHEKTNGLDGWVSLEVSPRLAYDPAGTLAAAKELFARAQRSNLYIKIPGTQHGLPAIEEAIFAGIPINITLLFSREHYLAAAESFTRGIERRIEAGLNPRVDSVASVFVSRWDSAVAAHVPERLRNQLGIATAKRTHKAFTTLLSSARWRRIYNLGGRPQRLLWASTGTKDSEASDILYVKALASPFTVNTMPDPTLNALASYTDLGELQPDDDRNCEAVLEDFATAGVNIDVLAERLQREGAESFLQSWNDLMHVISSKAVAIHNNAAKTAAG
jgi:transaldolase